MTAIYTPADDRYLETKAKERAEKAAAGDEDAIKREQIWQAIVDASQS